MTISTSSRTMAASREQLWAVLADFAAISAWAPGVDHSCLLSESATGIGATRRVQTGRITLVECVTKWEPRSNLSYTIDGLPPMVALARNEWQLEAVAAGTVVTILTNLEPGPRAAHKLLVRALGLKFTSAGKQMLAGLAEAAS